MRAVVWIDESTWEACIDQARELLPAEAQVKLLYVEPIDVEELAAEGGMLGRHPPAPPGTTVRALAAGEARALLASAQKRLATPALVETRRGHPEREVLEACEDADLLLLVRDGELRLGPKSLGRRTRFVVDHAPCRVVLGWRLRPPSLETVRLPPHMRA